MTVPDSFIDKYLPVANGDFVKIYLYLLRHGSDARVKKDPAALADVFSCTEGDIRRALQYWEKEGLLPKAKPSAASTQVSAARLRELNGQKEVQDLLYMAEVYKGGTLDQPYARTLLYFYDDLGFPASLVEYLMEYCVERGKNTTAYLRTVGLAWHAEGLTTLRAAKAHVKKHRAEVAEAETKAATGAAKKNKFNNFTQRTNDYDQLQKELARASRKKK